MKCNASGDPHPNIKWTKDGVLASQFNASGYLLHLVDVQRDDAGSYICTASNGYGDDATAIGIVNIRCKYTKHSFCYKSLIITTDSLHYMSRLYSRQQNQLKKEITSFSMNLNHFYRQ